MISFAITVHNEGESLERLLAQLCKHIDKTPWPSDEIVILDDFSDDDQTVRILEKFSLLSYIQIHQRALDRDFAAQKNHLNSLCSGDWIFQIDADETLGPALLKVLPDLVKRDIYFDLFHIPRVNTVEGLTPEHIKLWGWTVNKKGWVMWPDYQTRLYKNVDTIRWEGDVHERITGSTDHAFVEAPGGGEDEQFAILHHKDIARQEEQNAFYDTIQNQND